MKMACILILSVLFLKVGICQTDNISPHKLGDHFGGGIVFYIDETGNHGLIVALQDQSMGVYWANTKSLEIIANCFNMSEGFENTHKIIEEYGTDNAAGICDTLTLGGFTDWYLPSIKELSLMFKELILIGGFTMSSYWSSTEAKHRKGWATTAWGVHFGNGGKEFVAEKKKRFRVRPIRRF